MNPLPETHPPEYELYRSIGVVVWVSFVTAAIATALFFAIFDPLVILGQATYPLDWSRTASYSVGFFLFWILTSATGAMVAWLLATPIRSVNHLRQAYESDEDDDAEGKS